MKNKRMKFSSTIEGCSSPDELIVAKLIQEVRSFLHFQYQFVLDLDHLKISLNNIDILLEKVRYRMIHLHQKDPTANDMPLRI